MKLRRVKIETEKNERRAEIKREVQAEQLDKKDFNFVKNFRDASGRKVGLSKENALALCIFDFLTLHMDRYNAIVCSSKVLEDVFEVSRVTISKCISALKKHEFIKVVKSGTSNVYYIDTNISWSSYANQKVFAKFNAHVIVSESEQKEQIKIRKTLHKKTREVLKTIDKERVL